MTSNDENIKKMARLLREGATMLEYSCPQCGGLLFRLKNKKIICPTCEREVVFKKDINENKKKKSEKIKRDIKLPFFGEIIISEIGKYFEILQNTSQLTQVKEILEIIDKLISIFLKIEKLK
ncbi:MAG: Sjogren's syndrome/scleroderma autoantigen 1 family protein [Promethearchaeota archaeon]